MQQAACFLGKGQNPYLQNNNAGVAFGSFLLKLDSAFQAATLPAATPPNCAA
jgi:hypothetical protein